jgi:hypothetical protein
MGRMVYRDGKGYWISQRPSKSFDRELAEVEARCICGRVFVPYRGQLWCKEECKAYKYIYA